jgi:hypothetical protein
LVGFLCCGLFVASVVWSEFMAVLL